MIYVGGSYDEVEERMLEAVRAMSEAHDLVLEHVRDADASWGQVVAAAARVQQCAEVIEVHARELADRRSEVQWSGEPF